MLHHSTESKVLAFVAMLLGQIFTLLRFASDPVLAAVRSEVERIIQRLPLEPNAIALSYTPPDPKAPPTKMLELQTTNFAQLRKAWAEQHGDVFAGQVFDGKDPPPDATAAEQEAKRGELERENAELREKLKEQGKALSSFEDRFALLERKMAGEKATGAGTSTGAESKPG